MMHYEAGAATAQCTLAATCFHLLNIALFSHSLLAMMHYETVAAICALAAKDDQHSFIELLYSCSFSDDAL